MGSHLPPVRWAPIAGLNLSLAPSIAWVLAGMLAVSCGSQPELEQARRKRIVVLTVDTLRFDAFTAEAMPKTHGLMAAGQVFSNYYAATSTTQPTHATLLTGLHPWEHGVTRNGLSLREEFETLPEALRAEGFWTSAVVASFPLNALFGFSQGFDSFDDQMDDGHASAWVGTAVEDNLFCALGSSTSGRAKKALESAPDGPQFFWFHFFDPHDPYGDTPSGTGEAPVRLRALKAANRNDDPTLKDMLQAARSEYDRDVADVDRHIADVLQAVLADDDYETTIIFTSDHGESFGSNSSLGHGDRVSSVEVHVPLAILLPRELGTQPAVRTDVAGTIDVAATIARLAGLDNFSTGGRDLIEAGTSPAGTSTGGAFGMRRIRSEDRVEVRLDGSRHVQSEPRFFAVQGGLLIAGTEDSVWLADDPNGGATIPGAGEVRALFKSFAARLDSAGATDVDSEAAREALRALGYGN